MSAILNQRPLAARYLYVQAITPAMLLLRRTAGARVSNPNILSLLQSNPPQSRAVSRLVAVQRTMDAWWEKYSCTAFPLFLTRNKWQLQMRNFQVGDVVHLRYHKQFKDHLPLARITRLLPDKQGVVRTLVVPLRDNKSGPRGNLSNQQAGQWADPVTDFSCAETT